ncbi:tripartite tricarboxylate transporter TctB family protein [Saccharothrix sp. BKS2]|uniref:tripartite tricarboxylate transporter TctB family protein n=1 Tax=Saccharothrix sp. BKS2 TaxID=3064400 RepID=UPI0039E76FB6
MTGPDTGPAAGPAPGPSRAARVEEGVFAGLVVALGVFTLVDTPSIPAVGQAGTVGPRAFPYAVAALLLVTGVATLVAVLRGRLGPAEDAEDVDPDARTDWATVAKLVAVLVAHLVLIEPLGWPVAGAVLFLGAAWTLGAVWWKALPVAVVLALVAQVVFASGLGLSLPAGIFEGVPLLDG